MNLTETIDESIRLVNSKIEDCDIRISFIEEFAPEVKTGPYANKLKEQRETWKEHLNNLEFIKHETGLQEIDEMIENESQRTN
jgi:hypothetical protein